MGVILSQDYVLEWIWLHGSHDIGEVMAVLFSSHFLNAIKHDIICIARGRINVYWYRQMVQRV